MRISLIAILTGVLLALCLQTTSAQAGGAYHNFLRQLGEKVEDMSSGGFSSRDIRELRRAVKRRPQGRHVSAYKPFVRLILQSVRRLQSGGFMSKEREAIEILLTANPDPRRESVAAADHEMFVKSFAAMAKELNSGGYMSAERDVLKKVSRVAPTRKHPHRIYDRTYTHWSNALEDLKKKLRRGGMMSAEREVVRLFEGLQPQRVGKPVITPTPPTQPASGDEWDYDYNEYAVTNPSVVKACGRTYRTSWKGRRPRRHYKGSTRLMILKRTSELIELDETGCRERWVTDHAKRVVPVRGTEAFVVIREGGLALLVDKLGDVYRLKRNVSDCRAGRRRHVTLIHSRGKSSTSGSRGRLRAVGCRSPLMTASGKLCDFTGRCGGHCGSRMRVLLKYWEVLAVALIAGCSGTSDSPVDGGVDAGIDAGEDAGVDAGVDAGEDAGVDGGSDSGDFGDGDDDGDGDGDGESDGNGDDAHDPYWPWCPEASEYVGGDWGMTLRVTEEALYCATFDEMRTLEQELLAKARMRVIPGDYPMPEENGTYPFVLPFCLEFLEDGSQPEPIGPGEIFTNHSAGDQGTNYRFQITQPLQTAGGESWVLQANLYAFETSESLFVMDGTWPDPFSGYSFYFSARLCLNDCLQWLDNRWIQSCSFENADPQVHTLVFEGGQVQWHIRMGWSAASTEPAVYHRANGTLDGVDFDQGDYYRLIYNPEHHHFSRDFAVLFDAPIAGACGLKATGLDPWEDPPPSRVTTIHCDLSDIEERTIIEETFEWK